MKYIPTIQNSITPFKHNKILIISSSKNITYHNYFFVNFDNPSLLLIALEVKEFLVSKHSDLKVQNIVNLTYNYKLYQK